MLLVGETGTGKTTAIQELAKKMGRELHVFNMNQNTDSSDLLGGYKPVDLKHITKPLFDKFIELFSSVFSIDRSEQNKNFYAQMQKSYEENDLEGFIVRITYGMNHIR